MAHPAAAIANEFLKRAQAEGRQLTHMHMQKLVYIAHGWNLAVNNEPLIDEPFQAWDYGPVVPSLYRALREYGAGPVGRLIKVGDVFDTYDETDLTARLEPSEVRVIDQIWNDFKGFEAFPIISTYAQRTFSLVHHNALEREERTYRKQRNPCLFFRAG